MNRYNVQMPEINQNLGEYQGETPEQAIEAMRKSRGFYSDYYEITATPLAAEETAKESAPKYKDGHERADNWQRDSQKMRANMSRSAYRQFNHEED
jgi:hypothetical protein